MYAFFFFAELGKDLRQRWEMLAALDHDILWSLTDEQAEMLGDLFDDGYKLAMEEMKLPESFDATMKRMAVIIKRIGAVLTVLRMEDPSALEGTSPALGEESVVYCSDEDFKTLVMLAEKLTRHAALMTLMLPEEAEKVLETQVVSEAQDRADELLEALPDECSTAEVLEVGERLNQSTRAVEKYLKILVEDGKLERVKKGQYKKVKA